MNFKLIDKILGLLLIFDLIYLVFFLSHTYGAIFEFYQGTPLIVLVLRILLHCALGIAAAILLFRHLPVAKWALSAYVGITLLEKYWSINPNTDKWLQMVNELKDSTTSAGSSADVVVRHSVYPYWWVWALYLIGLIYVFTVRQRYNQRLKVDAK
jgi:hypothetical protein